MCAPSGKLGEACYPACASDADCRRDEGYACDPGWAACTPPGWLAPRLARCPGPLPPERAGLGPLVALSSSASPGLYQFEPAGAVTPRGDVVILHLGGGRLGSPSSLLVTRVEAGGAVHPARALPTPRLQHFDPWVAVDARGTVHAVWLGHDGGGVDRNAEVGYARSLDGGSSWTEPVAVHAAVDCPPDTPYCLDKPMIAAGPTPGRAKQDALLVFYYAEAGGGLRMRRSLDGGDAWSDPITVLDAAYGDAEVDARGGVHVAAVVGGTRGRAAWGSTGHRIVYVRSADQARFTAPAVVSAPDESVPFYFASPAVAVDARRGAVHVAYASGTPDGVWSVVLATSRDAGRTWRRRTVSAASSCANNAVPSIALVAASGDVHLTWYSSDGGAGHLAHARCPLAGTCTNAARVSPAMSAYQLVRHAATWVGEYGVLLADPLRRRVVAAWAQVEGDPPTARIRLREIGLTGGR